MKKKINEHNEASIFYCLAQSIMAQLVNAQDEDIDVAVINSLGELGKYFDVESVSLGGISKSGQLIPALYLWGRLPPKDTSLVLNPPPGPEMVAQFNKEGYLIYNRLEDLNDLPQFQEHTQQMGALAGAFWKYRDRGSWVEGMAFSSPNPKIWPDDIIERISPIGEVLFSVLYRRRAEAEVKRLRQFEQIIATAASAFVHLPLERVDAQIKKTLRHICTCVDADMSVLFQRQKNPKKFAMTVSHEWDDDNFVNGSHFLGAVLADEYPWLEVQLRESEPILIYNLDDFPPEANVDRATCERIGIQSMLWAPFMAAHGLQGYIALSTINRPGTWLKGILPQLGLLGNVLANAIERQRADLKLIQAHDEIQQLKDYLEAENITLREEIKASFDKDAFVGKSSSLQTVIHQVNQVSRTDSTVLLLSETGTGKTHIARLLHLQSRRKDRPLVTVNCAALPAELIESELFGHEKGAFTGAVDRKIGRFELADGGTIFLDEIGDMNIQLQAKLLRVLQDHEFERIGSSTTITVDTRIISATNRDLNQLIDQGKFRDDLYYRLGVFPIRLPPLRERRTDIPLLVWFFISELQCPLGKTIKNVLPETMTALTNYDWPGNVRELRNVIERAMILSSGTILELENIFPDHHRSKHASSPPRQQSQSLEEFERAHIVKVLEECNWKIRGVDGAAERLGLKRTTLQSRMKRLGLQRPSI